MIKVFQIKLKAAREQAEMSQFALAKMLGVAQSTVGGWEAGNREPDFNNLQQLAITLNTTTDYLIGLSDSKCCSKKSARKIRKLFSIRLKELRNESDISQNALAFKLGISQSTVGNWEAGNREPSLKTLSVLSRFFNVTSDYLIGLSDNKYNLCISKIPEQKKEVRSIKDQHPELIFYDDSQEPQIPRLEPVGKPRDQILTGDPSPKYFTPDTPSASSSMADVEMRKQNEEEMLQLFRKLSTRDQLKEITRLELLQGK